MICFSELNVADHRAREAPGAVPASQRPLLCWPSRACEQDQSEAFTNCYEARLTQFTPCSRRSVGGAQRSSNEARLGAQARLPYLVSRPYQAAAASPAFTIPRFFAGRGALEGCLRGPRESQAARLPFGNTRFLGRRPEGLLFNRYSALSTNSSVMARLFAE